VPYIDEAQYEGYAEAPIGPDEAATAAANYFNYRKLSIFGGSNEIQKNIISKMILGLCRQRNQRRNTDMNFAHTEDRRMLADSLNRFVSEQYGIEHRNQLAYGDEGTAPRCMRNLPSWARSARCSPKRRRLWRRGL
jgi:hypothetical protein